MTICLAGGGTEGILHPNKIKPSLSILLGHFKKVNTEMESYKTVMKKDSWTGDGVILLVDDEENIRSMCGIMLRGMGFQVITASHGREAVEIFREQPDKIACVVLDLSMPIMDGHQAFEIMTKIKPDVKVLVMSGFSTECVIGAFTNKEPVGLLTKPFLFSDLKKKMRQIFERQSDTTDEGFFGQLMADND